MGSSRVNFVGVAPPARPARRRSIQSRFISYQHSSCVREHLDAPRSCRRCGFPSTSRTAAAFRRWARRLAPWRAPPRAPPNPGRQFGRIVQDRHGITTDVVRYHFAGRRMAHNVCSVRTIIVPEAMAGVAISGSSIAFFDMSSKVGPAFTTKMSPSSLGR